MKLSNPMQVIVAFVGLLLAVPLGSALTIGGDAIDRGYGDLYSNFSMALLTEVVPHDTNVTGWKAYIKRIDGDGTSGDFALLFLEDLGSNQFEVKFIDQQTATSTGLKTYSVFSGVEAGWVMGIWMGLAKVAHDKVTGPDTTYTTNGALPSAPTVGQKISYTGTITDRVYSINATLPDSGATIALLGIALVGLAAVRRRWRRQ